MPIVPDPHDAGLGDVRGPRYAVERGTDGSWLVVDHGADRNTRLAIERHDNADQARTEATTLSEMDKLFPADPHEFADFIDKGLPELLAEHQAAIDAEHNFNHLLAPDHPADAGASEDVDGEVVAVAVVTRAGEVLLVRRAVPEPGLEWQFPAGKIRRGESALTAAKREVREETGVLIGPDQHVLGQRRHPTTGRHLVYVACTWFRGEPRAAAPTEVAEAAWADDTRFPELITNSDVMPEVLQYLQPRLWS